MTNKVKKEVEEIIKEYNLPFSVEEFKDRIDWLFVSIRKTLSESFIREFQDKVEWQCISYNQKLSESFI